MRYLLFIFISVVVVVSFLAAPGCKQKPKEEPKPPAVTEPAKEEPKPPAVAEPEPEKAAPEHPVPAEPAPEHPVPAKPAEGGGYGGAGGYEKK